MKIGIDAHCLEEPRTGVGRYLINILEKAALTPHLKSNLQFYLYFKKQIPLDKILNNPIFTKRVLNLPGNRSSFSIYFLLLLPWHLKKDRVDLAFFPSYMIPISYFGKSVITIHDLAYEAHPELFALRYRIPYRVFSRYGCYLAKKILAVSNFAKEEIIKYYHTDPDKIIVTYLGIDQKFKVIDNQGSLNQIKSKYQIKDKFIFYLGQIFNRRHVYESMMAFEKIAGQFKDYQFLIVGKNRTSPFIDIERAVKLINQKLKRQAILRQQYVPEEDLVLLYNAAYLSFYLSDYEGFGLPPLEAMACATPVITSNLTALKETAGPAAILIENPKNIDEIAQAIKKTLTDQAYYHALVKNGLERVKFFSWQKCAETTFNSFLLLQ